MWTKGASSGSLDPQDVAGLDLRLAGVREIFKSGGILPADPVDATGSGAATSKAVGLTGPARGHQGKVEILKELDLLDHAVASVVSALSS